MSVINKQNLFVLSTIAISLGLVGCGGGSGSGNATATPKPAEAAKPVDNRTLEQIVQEHSSQGKNIEMSLTGLKMVSAGVKGTEIKTSEEKASLTLYHGKGTGVQAYNAASVSTLLNNAKVNAKDDKDPLTVANFEAPSGSSTEEAIGLINEIGGLKTQYGLIVATNLTGNSGEFTRGLYHGGQQSARANLPSGSGSYKGKHLTSVGDHSVAASGGQGPGFEGQSYDAITARVDFDNGTLSFDPINMTLTNQGGDTAQAVVAYSNVNMLAAGTTFTGDGKITVSNPSNNTWTGDHVYNTQLHGGLYGPNGEEMIGVSELKAMTSARDIEVAAIMALKKQ